MISAVVMVTALAVRLMILTTGEVRTALSVSYKLGGALLGFFFGKGASSCIILQIRNIVCLLEIKSARVCPSVKEPPYPIVLAMLEWSDPRPYCCSNIE